jgi:CRISPR type III-B/RAMP module RAMP protein Cmr1
VENSTIPKEVIEEAKKRADVYLDSHMIASFTLTNITHTRIGGFNARSRSGSYFEYPREQSLKGIWRWWLRVLLSGSALEDSQIEQKVNELLGSSDTPAAFRITLTTKISEQPVYDESRFNNIPRLKLLAMGLQHGEKEESLSLYKPGTFELVVNVFSVSDKQRSESAIVIYALILAITFSGMGSITRRGFGKLALEVRKCPDNIIEIINRIQSAKNAAELEAALNELIKSAVIATERIYDERKSTVTRLPSHPALDKDGKYFKLSVILMRNIPDPVSVLQRIGNATLKSEWKYLRYGPNRKSLFRPGGEFHTWVLGLPRYQQNSGYEIPSKGNEARRSSAILITPHLLDRRWCAVVLGFKSLDWPSKIIHKPRSRSHVQPREINPQDNFAQYFDHAFEMVEKCLKDSSGGRQGW